MWDARRITDAMLLNKDGTFYGESAWRTEAEFRELMELECFAAACTQAGLSESIPMDVAEQGGEEDWLEKLAADCAREANLTAVERAAIRWSRGRSDDIEMETRGGCVVPFPVRLGTPGGS